MATFLVIPYPLIQSTGLLFQLLTKRGFTRRGSIIGVSYLFSVLFIWEEVLFKKKCQSGSQSACFFGLKFFFLSLSENNSQNILHVQYLITEIFVSLISFVIRKTVLGRTLDPLIPYLI